MPNEIPDSLRGIELTKEASKPQDEIVFIVDKERSEILNDPVRLQILQVLREGINDTHTTETVDKKTGDRIIRQREVKRDILSVLEIVKQSEMCCGVDNVISKNQVYHHLPKLIEGGFIIKYGTITTGKRTTDYYRRTAKGFVVTTPMTSAFDKRIEKKLKKYMDEMLSNFNLHVTDEDRKRLYRLNAERIRIQSKWRTKIAKMVRVDVADKEVLQMYEMLLDYYSMGSKEYLDTLLEIRKILFSHEQDVQA
ncbi:MAG: hypothetical protein ACP6KW_10835 [Candidatus Thorarchaeota archaeon]